MIQNLGNSLLRVKYHGGTYIWNCTSTPVWPVHLVTRETNLTLVAKTRAYPFQKGHVMRTTRVKHVRPVLLVNTNTHVSTADNFTPSHHAQSL